MIAAVRAAASDLPPASLMADWQIGHTTALPASTFVERKTVESLQIISELLHFGQRNTRFVGPAGSRTFAPQSHVMMLFSTIHDTAG
jgi:hypothetical protein